MMNLSFSDKLCVGDLTFGEMVLTGYKYVAVLDSDDQGTGWKAGDMIVVSQNDHPCFRIEPLFGAKLTENNSRDLRTLKHTKEGFILAPDPQKLS